MKLFGLLETCLIGLSKAQSDAYGVGLLELQTASYSNYSGFSGKLSVFIGRNCVINPQRGRICDFKHQFDVEGMTAGQTKVIRMEDMVDAHYDQILFSYRSKSEAMFSRMTLQVQPNNGGPQQVINLMNLAGGGQDYTIFDFDGIKKPCDSSYPGGIGTSSSCRFDTVYDLYTSKEKPHYSLFAGHVVKNNFNGLGSVDHTNIRSDTSMIHFKTGTARSDGTNADLMIYYGKNCKRVCDYTKELAALLKDYNKSYDFYLPEFDFENDQLIMDFRDSDGVSLAELNFTACFQGNCKKFDLYDFDQSHKNKLAFDFNSVTYPCGDRYDSYECVYDAVYDFKTSKVHFDKSVIMGQ